MKKILRSLGVSLVVLLPAAAIAAPSVRAACCDSGACCPHCPLCNHGG